MTNDEHEDVVGALEDLIIGYESMLATKDIYIDTLSSTISSLTSLNESYEHLVKLQAERIDLLSERLMWAANWIKRRKAADKDGFIPDDDLR